MLKQKLWQREKYWQAIVRFDYYLKYKCKTLYFTMCSAMKKDTLLLEGCYSFLHGTVISYLHLIYIYIYIYIYIICVYNIYVYIYIYIYDMYIYKYST